MAPLAKTPNLVRAQGMVRVTASDREVRTVPAGTPLLMEDRTGKRFPLDQPLAGSSCVLLKRNAVVVGEIVERGRLASCELFDRGIDRTRSAFAI